VYYNSRYAAHAMLARRGTTSRHSNTTRCCLSACAFEVKVSSAYAEWRVADGVVTFELIAWLALRLGPGVVKEGKVALKIDKNLRGT
jgi:hypothetical protein